MRTHYNVPPLKLKSSSSKDIVLDPTQQLAADTVRTGMSFAVSGPGGSGKTFVITNELLKNIRNYPSVYTRGAEHYRKIGCDPEHKYLKPGVPGVLFVSYTNPSVTVLRRNLDVDGLVIQYVDPETGDNTVRAIRPEDLAMTVNKLLQFRPADPETAANLSISKGSFYPYRCATNTLPPEITTVVLDEVGQLEVRLMLQFLAAIDLNRVQLILIGDICQTGSSYGPSTLIRGLVKLPRVAFDKVYRFSGHLLEFANEVNAGKVKDADGAAIQRKSGEGDDLNLINIGFFTPQEERTTDAALLRIKTALYKLVVSGTMCLYTDLFIIPQKTQDLSGNNIMGALFSLLDKLYGRPTYFLNTNAAPIILAVGDSILYNNQIGMVLDIGKNDDYLGDGRQTPMYAFTRDVDTWCLLHDQENLGTIDRLITEEGHSLVSSAMDKEITAPIPEGQDAMTALLASMDMGDDLDQDSSSADEEEKGTRQLTHSMLVLNVTGIDNGFVQHTAQSADATYKAFFTELLDHALARHTDRVGRGEEYIGDEDIQYYNHLLIRLTSKYGVNPDDVILQYVDKTSQLGSTGVKYNWRTVQQTQGSQSYSTFSVFHRQAHVAKLLWRENLYTAYSRSRSRQYGLISKALLDGSLSSGGVNGQLYPGQTVMEKLKTFLKRVRTTTKPEQELDAYFNKMLLITKKRKEHFDRYGTNMLLDPNAAENRQAEDVVASALEQLNLGSKDNVPF